MAVDDGGPAFPVGNYGDPNREDGMTLRDWFAGQALSEWIRAHIEGSVDGLSKEDIAVECYSYADAMLAQRSRK